MPLYGLPPPSAAIPVPSALDVPPEVKSLNPNIYGFGEHSWATLRKESPNQRSIHYGCSRCGKTGTVRDIEKRIGRCYPNPYAVGKLEFQTR